MWRSLRYLESEHRFELAFKGALATKPGSGDRSKLVVSKELSELPYLK